MNNSVSVSQGAWFFSRGSSFLVLGLTMLLLAGCGTTAMTVKEQHLAMEHKMATVKTSQVILLDVATRAKYNCDVAGESPECKKKVDRTINGPPTAKQIFIDGCMKRGGNETFCENMYFNHPGVSKRRGHYRNRYGGHGGYRSSKPWHRHGNSGCRENSVARYC